MPASFYAVIQGHDFWKGTFLLRFSNVFSDLEILTTLKLQELEVDLCFSQRSKKYVFIFMLPFKHSYSSQDVQVCISPPHSWMFQSFICYFYLYNSTIPLACWFLFMHLVLKCDKWKLGCGLCSWPVVAGSLLVTVMINILGPGQHNTNLCFFIKLLFLVFQIS